MSEEAQQNMILIVEDDEDTAELLTQQLERDGFSIDVARNGQEAILVTGEQPPNLVIMDVMMPKLNGFETTRFFKAKFTEAYVPVLVLSAKHAAVDVARGARFGCDDYLTKPYKRTDINEAVAQMLSVGECENGLRELDRQATSLEEEGIAAAAAPSDDHRAALAGIDSRRLGLRKSLTEVRLKVAERLISKGRGEVARGHLGRILELFPNHGQAENLLHQIGE